MTKRRRTEPLSVAELLSRFDPAHASVDWLRLIEQHAASYLRVNPDRPGAPMLQRAASAARLALKAIGEGDAAGAAMASLQALSAAAHAELIEARPIMAGGVTAYRRAERENLSRRAAAERERDEWRRRATEIRASNPRMSKADVARRIDAKRWNTIRRHI